MGTYVLDATTHSIHPFTGQMQPQGKRPPLCCLWDLHNARLGHMELDGGAAMNRWFRRTVLPKSPHGFSVIGLTNVNRDMHLRTMIENLRGFAPMIIVSTATPYQYTVEHVEGGIPKHGSVITFFPIRPGGSEHV